MSGGRVWPTGRPRRIWLFLWGRMVSELSMPTPRSVKAIRFPPDLATQPQSASCVPERNAADYGGSRHHLPTVLLARPIVDTASRTNRLRNLSHRLSHAVDIESAPPDRQVAFQTVTGMDPVTTEGSTLFQGGDGDVTNCTTEVSDKCPDGRNCGFADRGDCIGQTPAGEKLAAVPTGLDGQNRPLRI